MRQIVIIAHDIRSAHNVGSLLRTAEGMGVVCVWLTGYTPYPASEDDTRLPHVARRIDKAISKTALGAEKSQVWMQAEDASSVIRQLQSEGFMVAALEQAANAILLPDWRTPEKVAIVLGREVEGVSAEILAHCDLAVEIPMYGHKESYNVAQAAAMALYHCQFVG